MSGGARQAVRVHGAALPGLRMPALAVPGAAALVLGLALAAWAVSVLLAPPGRAAEAGALSTATVVEGDVGSELSLNATAEWQAIPLATNEAAGVITSVDLAPGTEAQQGTRLYSVNGRAVVVARGDMPAYRSLSEGDAGDDVRQFQQLLLDTGFYGGAVDGVFGADAREAALRWQQSHGEPATGNVSLGDVVFVPTLPARLTLDAALVRGARLVGAERVVLGLGPSPVFTVPVGASQAGAITTGVHVELTSGSGLHWQAVVAGRSAAPSGSTVVLGLEAEAPAAGTAAGAPAEPICGESCSDIPLTGQTLLAARIVTVPSVHGAVVPTVALQSDAQQGIAVVDRAGVRHPVTVLASARGMSVVRGVDPGLVVRIPGTPVSVGDAAEDAGR